MARHFAAMELVLIAIALSGLAPAHGMEPTPAHEATAQLVSDAKSDYLRKLAAYQAARQAFEELSAPYWDEVRQKRQLRSTKRRNGETIVAQDYVLTQPPLYSGPPRPVPPPDVREELPRPPALPVVADFLRHAHEQYRFAPTRPASEIDFKQAYAKIARAAGLTREQAVRIYAFEVGGNGKYDTQAGLEEDRPGARAISTALGYNPAVEHQQRRDHGRAGRALRRGPQGETRLARRRCANSLHQKDRGCARDDGILPQCPRSVERA